MCFRKYVLCKSYEHITGMIQSFLAMNVPIAIKHEKICTVLKMERFNFSVGVQIHFTLH
jgi:hypothetical protein